MPQKPARRAYSAEELLALRRSASDESASAIQQRVDDGTIRAHVVRNSRSAETRPTGPGLPQLNPRSSQSRASSHFTAPVLGEIDPNNQRLRLPHLVKGSPTSSIKRKAAQQILQQHGSPPHMRVTAGGRIVPSEQSPLCSPRYGFSAISKNGGLVKFAPGYPPPPKTFPNIVKSLPNGFVAQDPEGRLCQVVDGQLLIIPEVDGIPQLFITAPNVTNMAWSQYCGTSSDKSSSRQYTDGASSKAKEPEPLSGPTVAAQVAALEKHYQKLETERRNLDKAEVLKRSELTGKAYNQLIQKRRDLVSHQDELRRSIKTLQDSSSPAGSSQGHRQTSTSPESQPSQYNVPMTFNPGLSWPQAGVTGIHPSQLMVSSVGPDGQMVYPQAFLPGVLPPFFAMPQFGHPHMSEAGMTNNSLASPETFAQSGLYAPSSAPMFAGTNQTNEYEHDDLSGYQHMPRQEAKSGLNPMSPIYQPPAGKITTPEESRRNVTRTTTVGKGTNKSSPKSNPDTDTQGDDQNMQHSSASSYATADFFPQNPRDHSLRKHAYPSQAPKVVTGIRVLPSLPPGSSDEAVAQPELERHNAGWNPTIPDQAFQQSVSASERESVAAIPGPSAAASNESSSLANKSDEYIRGHNAGLQRAAIGEETGLDFISGYCKGLTLSTNGPSKVTEDSKPLVRLPNKDLPALPTLMSVGVSGHGTEGSAFGSFAALSNAITAPDNENAILSPSSDGPTVAPLHGKPLGSWPKDEGRHSMSPSGVHITDENDPNGSRGITVAQTATAPTVQSGPDSAALPTAASAGRTFSAQTQPAKSVQSSYLQRLYPGARVLSSPAFDWKTSHATAQVTGLAASYFAQFDGATSKLSTRSVEADKANTATRFREGPMPGEDAATSPAKSSASSSPKKLISPAKAKFAAIAGRAGIKVRNDRSPTKGGAELEPMSPQERRRWRDVWKKRNIAAE